MAEPTGSLLPSSYDDATSLLGGMLDHRNFVLAETISGSASTLTTLSNVDDMAVPFYMTVDNELIFCPTINANHDGWVDCIRGAHGTSAAAHTAGAAMWQAFPGKIMTLMRDCLVAAEKYHGLVGLLSARPATPVFAEQYVATNVSGGRAYFGGLSGSMPSWEWHGREAHADMDSLSADGHTQYHTDARALTWHGALSGSHVQGGDDHDHSLGTGIARVVSGSAASRPSASIVGEVYYSNDTKKFSFSPNGSSWVDVVGAPAGVICAFDETALAAFGGSCPTGWSRFTALDERFPAGAPSDEFTGLHNVGGPDAHTHTYNTVPSHSHVVALTSGVGPSSSGGSHDHDFHSGGGTYDEGFVHLANQKAGSTYFDGVGTHTHSSTWPSCDTNQTIRYSDGQPVTDTSGTTTEDDGKPAYHTVVFCKRN